MAKHLPRWALIGGGLAAASAAAAIVARRLFRGGYDERPLGEPVSYPAVGSGTGFPEPTSPEHTESVDRGIVTELRGPIAPREDGPANSVVGEPFFEPSSALPEDNETPHVAAGSDSAGAAAFTPLRPQDAPDATPRMPPLAPLAPLPPLPPLHEQEQRRIEMTETPRPLSPDDPANVDGSFTAVASEPLQRAPVPLTEQQAENSARIQGHQNQLYAAFPGLTPGDLVESDGDLDSLALIAAERARINPDNARTRLDAILNTGAEQHENAGIEPDLAEPRE